MLTAGEAAHGESLNLTVDHHVGTLSSQATTAVTRTEEKDALRETTSTELSLCKLTLLFYFIITVVTHLIVLLYTLNDRNKLYIQDLALFTLLGLCWKAWSTNHIVGKRGRESGQLLHGIYGHKI